MELLILILDLMICSLSYYTFQILFKAEFHGRSPRSEAIFNKDLTLLVLVFLFARSSFNHYRDSGSVVSNSGLKMVLRAFYFIRAVTKAQTYYYINGYGE